MKNVPGGLRSGPPRGGLRWNYAWIDSYMGGLDVIPYMTSPPAFLRYLVRHQTHASTSSAPGIIQASGADRSYFARFLPATVFQDD